MNLTDVANLRLDSQQISQTKFKTPKEIVSRMGAMQAQDYAMSKWGVGVRLPGSTQLEIERAVDKGKIIRTHVLRPTWHLVSPDDIYWMLELTAPHIKVLMRSQEKKLELTEKIYTKSNIIIEKALMKNKTLTRKELMDELRKAKINTNDIRAAHLMCRAELEGIVCNGIPKEKMPTYSLLTERAKKTRSLTREEAAAKLARIYFKSHCPATLKDFAWWSGLSLKDSRNALENARTDLISEVIDSETYWFTNSISKLKTDNQAVYLLPAYDEFIISYNNRNAALPKDLQGRAFTNNGLFKPVIVEKGKVIGLWRRTFVKEKVRIETEFFKPVSKATIKTVKKAAVKYGEFLNKETDVRQSS